MSSTHRSVGREKGGGREGGMEGGGERGREKGRGERNRYHILSRIERSCLTVSSVSRISPVSSELGSTTLKANFLLATSRSGMASAPDKEGGRGGGGGGGGGGRSVSAPRTV